ncbi:MAG: hypothetical protein J2P21_10470 [Chloracidobacterium sp.]|nr:hypothetical protein [Chloracidobacterium sp.]
MQRRRVFDAYTRDGADAGVTPMITRSLNPISSLVRSKGSISAFHNVFHPADGRSVVRREDLADDQPIEEHPDRRQMLLGGRRFARALFNVSADERWRDLPERRNAAFSEPVEEHYNKPGAYVFF